MLGIALAGVVGLPGSSALAQAGPRSGDSQWTAQDGRAGVARAEGGRGAGPQVVVTGLSLREGSPQMLMVGLRNSGGATPPLSGTVQVATAQGRVVQSVPLEVDGLAPQASTSILAPVGGVLPPGDYSAMLALAGGGVELRHTSSFSLRGGDGIQQGIPLAGPLQAPSEAPAPPAAAASPLAIMPSSLPRLELPTPDPALVALLAAAGLAYRLYPRLRRRWTVRATPPDDRVASLTNAWMARGTLGGVRTRPIASAAEPEAETEAGAVDPQRLADLLEVRELLRRGQEAVRAGDDRAAYHCFIQAVSIDAESEDGWLWLASTLNRDDAIRCLQRVLRINPENELARQGLVELEAAEASSRPAA